MKKAAFLIVLLIVFALAACGKKEETTPTPSPAKSTAPSVSPTASPGGTSSAAGGQAVYKQNCISCHGDNLQGGVGPNLSKVGGKLSKDQITTVVSNGRGAMPAFKGRLSDADIGAIADWLATQK